MEWDDYKLIYIEHLKFYIKSKLLVDYSTKIFNDFPKNLPLELAKEAYDNMNSVSSQLSNLIADTDNGSGNNAFFHDTVKIICMKQPRVMLNLIDDEKKKKESINNKSIDWDRIIDLGDYDSIINFMVDEFNYRLRLFCAI